MIIKDKENNPTAFKDLTGQVFGELTVIKRDNDYVSPKGYHLTKWLCQCSCGETVSVTTPALKQGRTKTCGKHTLIDLVGQKFGRLTVIKRVENHKSPNGQSCPKWLCKCDCGSEVVVWGRSLRDGHTVSCGCYQKERAKETFKKYNKCEDKGSYVVMYTEKGEPFYVDKDDYLKVKDICWYRSDNGYIMNKTGDDTTLLHRLIMDCPDGLDVDHLGGVLSRNDNRKYNLRIATVTENTINKGLQSNNTSGCTGVCKRGDSWYAQIVVNGKHIYLGQYKDKSDAIAARKEAENKYFGEWSYENSQRQYKEKLNEINREDMVI